MMNPNTEAAIDHLARLVAYPSISADSNLDLIADLAQCLEAAGARAEVIKSPCGTKANLWASMGPDMPDGLVLSGHTDVVPVADQDWSTDPFTLMRHEDKLFGRGTCDMKGFIAAAVTIAQRVDVHKPLHFAFTYDEEVGCLGGRTLMPIIEACGVNPAIVIVGEPTGMAVVEGHKGCCEYTTHISGLEGHGSDPAKGVNAAEYAARYVTKLLELRGALMARTPENSRFDPPWTTLNVGRISAGVAHNVIASKAEIDWEMRPVVQDDAAFVKRTLEGYIETEMLPMMRAIYPDADISTDVIGEVAGLTPVDENTARDLLLGLLGANAAGLVPFGTEAGLFQAIGADVVICGPGHIAQAHMADEYLEVAQLSACLDLLEKVICHD